jgi:hypothetical protein
MSRPPVAPPRIPVAPATTALMALGCAAAHGQVVFTPSSGNTAQAGEVLYIDIDGGTTVVGSNPGGADLQLVWLNGNSSKPYLAHIGSAFQFSRTVLGDTNYVSRLSSGATISDSVNQPAAYNGPFAYYANGPWVGGGTDNVGFSFSMDEGVTTLYGWMNLTFSADTGTVTVNGWAYDENGNFVQVSPIPEPAGTTAGIAAAVLAGSAAIMRRRRAAATAA